MRHGDAEKERAMESTTEGLRRTLDDALDLIIGFKDDIDWIRAVTNDRDIVAACDEMLNRIDDWSKGA